MLAFISFIRLSEQNDGDLEDDDDDEGNDDDEVYEVTMYRAGPGFTLPVNIGDLDPAIAELHLGGCNLTGELCRGF